MRPDTGSRVLHVKEGSDDCGDGSVERPFRSIQQAADVALAGDVVMVHAGTYRESVNPINGGKDRYDRITYTAAPGEHPVIKGSERVNCWQDRGNSVWTAEIDNSLFGSFNPFATPLKGDWLERPSTWNMTLGEVYINGKSMYQAPDVESVRNPQMRKTGFGPDWVKEEEPVAHPEDTVYQWYAQVGDRTTCIWANFQGYDPNASLVEINVRPTCFYPLRTGINYITVTGFEMAQAACQWAPPTGDQQGLIGTHWSKGWVIEGNDLHDARCSAVSLGKDWSTGDSESTRWGYKPGYQTQLETVFRARHAGWDMETVGSHLVRNNHIHDCGQNGVVGHLGCIRSVIEDNDIHDIGNKHEFFGHEIAGIKLHTAIDVIIRHNHIHDSTLGIWLDWEAQGTRVSSNVFNDNIRDFMIEVTHGPCLVDNNVFASAYNLDNVAQGTAFVHNLFCGSAQRRDVLDRFTPYHLPHSTTVAGTACVYGSDDRIYQNIFVGGEAYLPGVTTRGTETYEGCPGSMDEYRELVHAHGPGDLELFERVKQPAYIDRNVYLNGAQSCSQDIDACKIPDNPRFKVVTDHDGSVWLDGELPEAMFHMGCRIVDTAMLGAPRMSEERYEAPDGSSIAIDRDLTGVIRGDAPVPGPLEGLTPGKNHVRLM